MNLKLVALTALFASLAHAEGPCHDKREAKHGARKALHECIESWARDNRPGEAEPTDTCAAKLGTFVQASKDVKSCVTEKVKERQEKKNK